MGSAFGGGGGGGGGTPDAFNRGGGRQPSTQPDEGGGTGITPGVGGDTGVVDGGLEKFPTVNPSLISAGGGFLGRTPFGTPVEKFGNMPSQMAAYNPFYAGMSGGDLADRTYRQIMKRSPDLLTQQGMQRQMEEGLTGQGLVGSLTSSPEFQRQQEVQRAYTEAFRPGYQEFGPSGQYYQPIYQSNYTNYSRSPFFYQPSYGASMMSPSMMGYGFGSFNPNPFSYGGYGGGGGGYGGGYGGGGGGYGGGFSRTNPYAAPSTPSASPVYSNLPQTQTYPVGTEPLPPGTTFGQGMQQFNLDQPQFLSGSIERINRQTPSNPYLTDFGRGVTDPAEREAVNKKLKEMYKAYDAGQGTGVAMPGAPQPGSFPLPSYMSDTFQGQARATPANPFDVMNRMRNISAPASVTGNQLNPMKAGGVVKKAGGKVKDEGITALRVK